MALKKITDLNTGVVVEYHRISCIEQSFLTNLLTIKVVSYLDQDARVVGKNFVTWKAYELVETFKTEIDRAAAYAKLKELPEFDSADDVLEA